MSKQNWDTILVIAALVWMLLVYKGCQYLPTHLDHPRGWYQTNSGRKSSLLVAASDSLPSQTLRLSRGLSMGMQQQSYIWLLPTTAGIPSVNGSVNVVRHASIIKVGE